MRPFLFGSWLLALSFWFLTFGSQAEYLEGSDTHPFKPFLKSRVQKSKKPDLKALKPDTKP
jgi:hypothetical protein